MCLLFFSAPEQSSEAKTEEKAQKTEEKTEETVEEEPLPTDEIVYPEREMAEKLAVQFGCDNIFDYIELTEDVGIYEIAVPDEWVGKSIIKCSVRAKYNISILAVKVGEKISPMPSPEHVFDADERLMVMGEHSSVKRLTR